MFGRKKVSEPAPEFSPEDLAQLFPRVAESLDGAAAEARTSACDMQSAFWFQALSP